MLAFVWIRKERKMKKKNLVKENNLVQTCYCDSCKKKIYIGNNTFKKRKICMKEIPEELFELGVLECPHCGSMFQVLVDNIKTNNILSEMKNKAFSISTMSTNKVLKDKKKYFDEANEKIKTLEKELSDERMQLAKRLDSLETKEFYFVDEPDDIYILSLMGVTRH